MELEKNIDGQVKVHFDLKKMKAYLEITPPFGEGKPVSFEQAKQVLNNNNVIFGVNEEQINNALRKINYERRIEVAEGKPAIDGIDGKLIYKFPLPKDRIKPQMDEKGNANFHELGLIYNVEIGQPLVERIPPEPGIDGRDVLGQTIKAKSGKDFRLPKGKNTVIDAEDKLLYAVIAGNVSFIDGKVLVQPIYEIDSDVDFSTGDIDFIGNVVVRGNVSTGFKVKAAGDIEIWGFIEGAEVIAGGNILVKGGIAGNLKGLIKAGENITARFAENSRLEAGQDILIREGIMQSYIKAGGSVKVSDKRAIIVGGVVQAAMEVESKVLGSQLATQTIIEVGINPHYREELQQIVKDRTEKKKVFENLNHNLQLYQKSAMSPETMNEKKRAQLIVMLDQFKNMKKELNQMEERILFLQNEFYKISNFAKVRALEAVYPGVRISIGQSIYIVNDAMKFTQFVLDEGEVKITSLR